jgi:hypothetical protein
MDPRTAKQLAELADIDLLAFMTAPAGIMAQVQFWAETRTRRAVADAERPLLAKIRALEEELASARKAAAKAVA